MVADVLWVTGLEDVWPRNGQGRGEVAVDLIQRMRYGKVEGRECVGLGGMIR